MLLELEMSSIELKIQNATIPYVTLLIVFLFQLIFGVTYFYFSISIYKWSIIGLS